MVLSRWSPFATLTGLRTGWEPLLAPVYRAPMDVQRTEDGYRLRAALPGFKPEDVEVSLDQGTLTISAKRSQDNQMEQGRYLRREVFSGRFRQRLALPSEVKPEDVTASLEDGVLTVDVRYAPEDRAVRIRVGGGALPERTEQPAEQTEQTAA